MQKTIYIEELGSEIIIARRRGTKSMRISMMNAGKIRLSIPYSVSEKQALKYLASKSDWILKHQKPVSVMNNGDRIGKSHRLVVEHRDQPKITTRLKQNEIVIKIPLGMSSSANDAQAKIKQAAERALKQEASHLLPQRLDYLASKHGIEYSTCAVKKLRSRWGSCDSNGNIVLNIYLMQLGWDLIDYVILHELTHTIHQNHQSDFWDFLANILPEYKSLRKQLKQNPTDVVAS